MFLWFKRSNLKSTIDFFDSGILSGWVYDPSRPNNSEKFYVELNGKVIKRAIADRYRSDLEIAGMGNGYHGFSVRLPSSQIKLGRNIIRLLDLSKRVVRNSTRELMLVDPGLECTFSQPEPYIFRFKLTANGIGFDLGDEQVLRFYADEDLLFECDLRMALATSFVEISLPSCVVDGQSHHVSLGLSGCPIPLWSQNDFIADELNLAPLFGKKYRDFNSTCNKVLFVDAKYPVSSEDAGSVAAINELKLIKALGYDIFFASEKYIKECDSTCILNSIGVDVVTASYYVPFERLIEAVLSCPKSSFEFIYINRFSIAEKLLPYVKELKESLPIVLNIADLHFLREMRNGLSSNSQEKLDQARDTQRRELGVISKVDAVLTYTPEEKAVISSHLFKQDNIYICPWVLERKENTRSFYDREGLAFIGGYHHEPNLEALEYIVNVIAPALYLSSPEIKIFIYGSYMPDYYAECETPNVEFIGYIEDVSELYHKHRIFIAPLLSGAGIKGKVLEAISYGLPTILSSMAIEGISLIENVNTLIANTENEWVDQISHLYSDEDLWKNISFNQQEMIENQYSYVKAVQQMKSIFSELRSKL